MEGSRISRLGAPFLPKDKNNRVIDFSEPGSPAVPVPVSTGVSGELHLPLGGLGLPVRFSSLRINSRAIKPMPTQIAESAILKAGHRKERM
jgi:hypothetical protein